MTSASPAAPRASETPKLEAHPVEIEYTVLRCLARHPMSARRGVSEPHRKKITTLDGVWWPTGRTVEGLEALERDPGRKKALAWCHQCRVATEYEQLRP